MGDALHGAGMYSLFKLSAYQRDDQARPEDVVMEASYPEWVKALAFTAIRRSVTT